MNALEISQRDHRQHERLPFSGPVRISWENERGPVRYAHAKCLNASEDGLRIEMAEPIAVGSRLLFRVDKINFSGSATVRSVTWRACKYILGLNLSQTQRVKPLASTPGAQSVGVVYEGGKL